MAMSIDSFHFFLCETGIRHGLADFGMSRVEKRPIYSPTESPDLPFKHEPISVYPSNFLLCGELGRSQSSPERLRRSQFAVHVHSACAHFGVKRRSPIECGTKYLGVLKE